VKTDSTINPRFTDLATAAAYSSYSKRQLYQFVRKGILPAYRLHGGKLLIDLRELDDLIKSRRYLRG
jgi:excisionase family DNA binding protein